MFSEERRRERAASDKVIINNRTLQTHLCEMLIDGIELSDEQVEEFKEAFAEFDINSLVGTVSKMA